MSGPPLTSNGMPNLLASSKDPSSSITRKRPRLESPNLTDATSTGSATDSPIHPVATLLTNTIGNLQASSIEQNQEEEGKNDNWQDGQRGGNGVNDANDEQDQEMQDGNDKEDGIAGQQPSQGDQEDNRHFFRYTVDSSRPLGANALSPDRAESIMWKVRQVNEGSQAESLGIQEGQFIYSLCGRRVTGEDDLKKLMMSAKQGSTSFEIVMTDMPLKEDTIGFGKAVTNATATPQPDLAPTDHAVTRYSSGDTDAQGAEVVRTLTAAEPAECDPSQNIRPNGGSSGSARSAARGNRREHMDDASATESSSPAAAAHNVFGTPDRQVRVSPKNMGRHVQASPAIREAMSITNSPLSNSPYHPFDRRTESIVPSESGTMALSFDILRPELRKYIKASTKNYCLFPQDGKPWLDYALNLVFASLWYNAPDRGLGWNRDVDKCRSLGIKANLKGPQPWMATRAFVISCIKDMLEAEDNDWICSDARKHALKKFYEPRIKKHLKAWKDELSQPKHANTLQMYTDGVWGVFARRHLSDNDGVGSLHKLTERYVFDVAGGLWPRLHTSSVDVSSGYEEEEEEEEEEQSIDNSSLDAISRHVTGACACVANGCTCKCKKLRYEVFPFAGANNLNLVTSTVLRRFQENHTRLYQSHITYDSVRAILDDLEDDSSYITGLNGLFTVTVKLSAVSLDGGVKFGANEHSQAQGVEANNNSSAATTGETTRTYSTAKVKGARVYAAFMDDQYYWGYITKENVPRRKGGPKSFEVTFEDGDVNPNVLDVNMITETEYVRCFETVPPEPEVHVPRKTMERETRKKRRRRQKLTQGDRANTDSGIRGDEKSADPYQFLVGRGYCYEWTNIQGQNNVIFGVVSSCSKSTDAVEFTIDYDDESRSFMNEMSASFGSEIGPSQEIASDLVWGGCVNFERKSKVYRGKGSSVIKNLIRAMPFRHVVVPDMRKEELVDYNGIKLPKLTLVFRGYQLVFSVKTSSIPNAGYGVFLKCTTLTNDTSSRADSAKNAEIVLLKVGELLDMGVYGPLRSEDKKHASVHHLKNYVFFGKCEEWCINCTDGNSFIYDVTDDRTGEPHELARQHILMYINECGPSDAPTVHTELDPEGFVHYLMGTRYHGDWRRFKEESAKFDLNVDGDEVEIFLNHGERYEPVRIRKGQSSLPQERQEEELAAFAEHEAGLVREIDLYEADEVVRCVSFFINRCILVEDYNTSEKRIDGEVRDRALRVCRKLRGRATELLRQIEQKKSRGDDSTIKALSKAVASTATFIQWLQVLPCDRK